jgi:hypothetical protein
MLSRHRDPEFEEKEKKLEEKKQLFLAEARRGLVDAKCVKCDEDIYKDGTAGATGAACCGHIYHTPCFQALCRGKGTNVCCVKCPTAVRIGFCENPIPGLGKKNVRFLSINCVFMKT